MGRRTRAVDVLRRDWERFGEEDPLWAVLTAPERRGGRWELEEFLATGRAQVGEVLARLDELGLARHGGAALDFGCGVGRLTQALAPHVDEAHGVDISASMVDEARRLDRTGTCTFHHNVAEDLALFPDGRFDLVLSLYVLQHIPRRLAARYVAELGRVVAPGGVLVLQVFRRREGFLGPLRQWARGAVLAGRRAVTGRPMMEMHPWSVRRMTAMLQAGGLRVVATDHVAGTWQQVTYVATRPPPER